MTVRKPDGSIYRPLGSLKQFDPSNPTHDLFNRWDQEAISLGGSPVHYLELSLTRSSIDKLYHEARNKLWAQHPVELTAVYDPMPSQSAQGLFGIDGPDDLIFMFNYKAVLDAIGHPPVIGSRVFSPHLRENWEVVDRKLGDFHKWGAVRLELHCTRFREDRTTGDGRVTQQQPDFEIN